jgi:hypothetical protein
VGGYHAASHWRHAYIAPLKNNHLWILSCNVIRGVRIKNWILVKTIKTFQCFAWRTFRHNKQKYASSKTTKYFQSFRISGWRVWRLSYQCVVKSVLSINKFLWRGKTWGYEMQHLKNAARSLVNYTHAVCQNKRLKLYHNDTNTVANLPRENWERCCWPRQAGF